MAVVPSFADGEKARDETEAKDTEAHRTLKVGQQAHHHGGQRGGHTDERARKEVCGVMNAHCDKRIPLEKTNVFVLFVPTTEMLPLNGSLVFVLPASSRIAVTLLVLVRAGSERPRFVRAVPDDIAVF